jgi:hypothetical protein
MAMSSFAWVMTGRTNGLVGLKSLLMSSTP